MTNDLQNRLESIKQKIQQAATDCARDPEQITLIAVSKTYPASDIQTLFQCGQHHFGENYVQEWRQKLHDLQHLPIQWHFIGPIQSNKIKHIAQSAHWVHSVDSFKTAQKLSQYRNPSLPDLNICIQINISGESSKQGIAPELLLHLAQEIQALPHLNLRGLMCIAEDTTDHQKLSLQFAKMQIIFNELQTQCPQIDALSMGMSSDLELAITYGATHVRVGSAIFGPRQTKKKTT